MDWRELEAQRVAQFGPLIGPRWKCDHIERVPPDPSKVHPPSPRRRTMTWSLRGSLNGRPRRAA